MTNPHRGETAIEIAGTRARLVFTLAALAEIEAVLGVDGLEALGARMRRLTARELTGVLAALLRAGGADDPDALAGKANPHAAAQGVAGCFLANLA
jgi:hypothetical protein